MTCRPVCLASLLFLLPLLGCHPDVDGDGLSRADEEALGTDPELADTDGDGVSDADEQALGTDPLEADSDGDRLTDGEEREAGTDPLAVDSDGDGYDDFSERFEGSDPTDPESVIYLGGWPYNPDKAALGDPGIEGPHGSGDQAPRRTGRDQYGQIVDLYDFAGHDRPIMVDVSALWCGPCQAMALWLEAGDDPLPETFGFDEYDRVQQAVENGEITWITLMAEGEAGTLPDQAAVDEWATSFPAPFIPVLTDRNRGMSAWADVRAYPAVMFFDADMRVIEWDPNRWRSAMERATQFAENNGLGLED